MIIKLVVELRKPKVEIMRATCSVLLSTFMTVRALETPVPGTLDTSDPTKA